MRTILALLLCVSVAHARAEVPPDPQKDAVIAYVLENFWDWARDSNGEAFQPTSELERTTVPIPTNIAYRALDAGKISGRASLCGIGWREHERAIRADAKKLGLTEKQVAFVRALYAERQTRVVRSRMPSCSDSEQRMASHRLFASKRLGLKNLDVSAEDASEE
jgi:hypothetical protein